MPWWKVLLHSEGWRLDIGDQPREYGFYTTRCVEGNSADEAADAAREDARRELRPMIRGEEEPFMRVERMFESDDSASRSGFVFYRVEACREGEPEIRVVANPFRNRLRRLLRGFRLR
jgi:hypothetical protein